MDDIKLSKLPDRTPVKLAVVLSPQLHSDLKLYQALYRDNYGQDEELTELIPAMLANFLASDRAFVRARGKTS